MAMHNKRLAHDEEKGCYVCGKPTKVFMKGKKQEHPRCDPCVDRLAEEFTKALAQQKKQDQAASSRRKEG